MSERNKKENYYNLVTHAFKGRPAYFCLCPDGIVCVCECRKSKAKAEEKRGAKFTVPETESGCTAARPEEQIPSHVLPGNTHTHISVMFSHKAVCNYT